MEVCSNGDNYHWRFIGFDFDELTIEETVDSGQPVDSRPEPEIIADRTIKQENDEEISFEKLKDNGPKLDDNSIIRKENNEEKESIEKLEKENSEPSIRKQKTVKDGNEVVLQNDENDSVNVKNKNIKEKIKDGNGVVKAINILIAVIACIALFLTLFLFFKYWKIKKIEKVKKIEV